MHGKSSYTMSSNVHNCTDMQVPADTCMKKDRHVEACKACVDAEYMLSATTQLYVLSHLSTSVLMQLNGRMYGMGSYMILSWYTNTEFLQTSFLKKMFIYG